MYWGLGFFGRAGIFLYALVMFLYYLQRSVLPGFQTFNLGPFTFTTNKVGTLDGVEKKLDEIASILKNHSTNPPVPNKPSCNKCKQ